MVVGEMSVLPTNIRLLILYYKCNMTEIYAISEYLTTRSTSQPFHFSIGQDLQRISLHGGAGGFVFDTAEPPNYRIQNLHIYLS